VFSFNFDVLYIYIYIYIDVLLDFSWNVWIFFKGSFRFFVECLDSFLKLLFRLPDYAGLMF